MGWLQKRQKVSEIKKWKLQSQFFYIQKALEPPFLVSYRLSGLVKPFLGYRTEEKHTHQQML